MLTLVGISSRLRNRDGELVEPLPAPLLPNEPPRTDNDGNHLFNPAWNEPSTTFVNDQYLNHTVDLIIQQEVVSILSSAAYISTDQHFIELAHSRRPSQSKPDPQGLQTVLPYTPQGLQFARVGPGVGGGEGQSCAEADKQHQA